MTTFDTQVEAAWHAALDGQAEEVNMKAGIKASNAVLAEKVRELHTVDGDGSEESILRVDVLALLEPE